MFPLRYEYRLHIKSKAIPVKRQWRHMFPVKYEYRVHIKNKAIPVIGSGGMCFLRGTNIVYI
jgi:small nuclear ribonucleoprotein (snRNP)-like protein